MEGSSLCAFSCADYLPQEVRSEIDPLIQRHVDTLRQVSSDASERQHEEEALRESLTNDLRASQRQVCIARLILDWALWITGIAFKLKKLKSEVTDHKHFVSDLDVRLEDLNMDSPSRRHPSQRYKVRFEKQASCFDCGLLMSVASKANLDGKNLNLKQPLILVLVCAHLQTCMDCRVLRLESRVLCW